MCNVSRIWETSAILRSQSTVQQIYNKALQEHITIHDNVLIHTQANKFKCNFLVRFMYVKASKLCANKVSKCSRYDSKYTYYSQKSEKCGTFNIIMY